MNYYEALAFMKAAHEGQTDKSGQPYWTHPVRVAEYLGEDAPAFAQIAALLHDVLEDTTYTPQALLEMGLDPRALEIVQIVTRRDETYTQFIERVVASKNMWAIRVKLADNTDNLARPLPPELLGLHNRYKKARVILSGALRELRVDPSPRQS